MLNFLVCSNCCVNPTVEYSITETVKEYRKHPDLYEEKDFNKDVQNCYEHYADRWLDMWNNGICGCGYGKYYCAINIQIVDDFPSKCPFALEHTLTENTIGLFEIFILLGLPNKTIKQRLKKAGCNPLGKIGKYEYYDKNVLEKIKNY